MAFSVSRPFRLPVWTNPLFLASLIVLCLMGMLFVFLPDGNRLATTFEMLPFTDDATGASYYDYRAWVAVGILLNCIATYSVEKLLIGPVTRWSDRREDAEKKRAFDSMMQNEQAKDLNTTFSIFRRWATGHIVEDSYDDKYLRVSEGEGGIKMQRKFGLAPSEDLNKFSSPVDTYEESKSPQKTWKPSHDFEAAVKWSMDSN